MTVSVCFHSYFKDLTGTERVMQELADGSTIAELCGRLTARFPRLEAMRKSTLIAVGVDYQGRSYELKEGDEVSFFPPVQGG